MSYQNRKPFGTLAAGLILGVLTSITALAQDNRLQVDPKTQRRAERIERRNQPAETQAVEQSKTKINRRAPIPFVPFEMVDPKSKGAVTPDFIFTLPNRKQVKAGEYYAELNRIERSLNELGYSLRTMPDHLVLQESVVDKQGLDRQASAVRSAGSPAPAGELTKRFGSNTVPDSRRRAYMADELTPEVVSSVIGGSNPPNAARPDNNRVMRITLPDSPAKPGPKPVTLPPGVMLKNLPTSAPPKTFHQEQPWCLSLGSPSTFQAYINGKFVMDGKAYPLPDASSAELFKSKTEFSLSGEAQAGGAILGTKGDILRARASFYAPADTSKPLNVKANVFVMGITVYDLSKDFSDKWSKEDTASGGVEFKSPFSVPLGPVVVEGIIGAKGDAGFSYGISLSRAGARGHMDPFVHTNVYGEGGAGIYIGGVGLGADMSLLNGESHLYANAGLGWFTKWILFDEMYADYKLDMLKGRTYGYVYVYYPCLSEGFCKKQWEHDFWNSPGLTVEGVLIDEKKTLTFDKW